MTAYRTSDGPAPAQRPRLSTWQRAFVRVFEKDALFPARDQVWFRRHMGGTWVRLVGQRRPPFWVRVPFGDLRNSVPPHLDVLNIEEYPYPALQDYPGGAQ